MTILKVLAGALLIFSTSNSMEDNSPPPSPIREILSPEILVRILEYVPESNLQSLPAVYQDFEKVRLDILSKTHQTVIKNCQDLESYLQISPCFKLRHVKLQFHPNKEQLDRLKAIGGLQINIPAPIHYNKVKKAIELLSCDNITLQLTRPSMQPLWSIPEMKDLWKGLDGLSEISRDRTQQKVRQALKSCTQTINIETNMQIQEVLPYMSQLEVKIYDTPETETLQKAFNLPPHLISLTIEDVCMDAAEALCVLSGKISTHEKLRSLRIFRTPINFNAPNNINVAAFQKLTSLTLKTNKLGDSGVMAIAEMLTTNHSLVSLTLEHNEISPQGVEALVTALVTNKHLTLLDLSRNKINNQGAEALAMLIQNNATIKALELGRCGLTGEGIMSISASLRSNSSLTKLNLNHNSIGYKGASGLAQAIQLSPPLQELKLMFTEIGEDGLQEIAAAVAINSKLTSLDLAFNNSEDRSITAFTNTISTNKTLTHLNLRSLNRFSDAKVYLEAIKVLANAIKVNTSLLSLGISTSWLENLEGEKILVSISQEIDHRSEQAALPPKRVLYSIQEIAEVSSSEQN
ncbi:hypothetical protein [Candidatus Odyssella thessalonicensis]|uniref:hypothetical protein n=1 Tax=Candidatus Odyssella thessalonicensis TaxID=84647 RepID=UPI000225BEA6|nr:hypothetical protein [Candidatus Odyssella thessalonicensis]